MFSASGMKRVKQTLELPENLVCGAYKKCSDTILSRF